MRGYAVYTDDFPPPDGYVWAAAGQLQQDYALPSAYKAYLKDALRLLRRIEAERLRLSRYGSAKLNMLKAQTGVSATGLGFLFSLI